MDDTRDIVFGIKLVVSPPRGGLPKPKYIPLSIVDFYEVVEEIMEIDPQDMFTVQLYGPDSTRIDVVMLNKDKWNFNEIDDHIGNTYLLRSGKKATIVKPFEELKEVRVRRVPAIWKKENLMSIFNFYGDVKSIEMEKMRATLYNGVKASFTHLNCGTYKIKMKLKKDIPSTLVVSGYKLEIYHYGQRQTCWTCGMAHYKNECRTEYRDFVNRFDINDFPPISVIRSETLTTDQVNAKKAAPGSSDASGTSTTTPGSSDASGTSTTDENAKTNVTNGASDGNVSSDEEAEFMDADQHTDHTYHSNTTEVNSKDMDTEEVVPNEDEKAIPDETDKGESVTNGTERVSAHTIHTEEKDHINATNTEEENHINANNNEEGNHINATHTEERNYITDNTKENHTDERNQNNADATHTGEKDHINEKQNERNHLNVNSGEENHKAYHNCETNQVNAIHTENKDHLNATHTKEKSQTNVNVSKVNLIEPVPNDVVNKQSDTSDGEGTINRAYDKYIEKENEKANITVAQVHKSVNSQEFTDDLNSATIYESEETETAEDEQCVIECENSQGDKPMVWTVIGSPVIGDKGLKRFMGPPSSSEDEPEKQESNSIIYNLGSLVNSFLPISRDKGKKKVKQAINNV